MNTNRKSGKIGRSGTGGIRDQVIGQNRGGKKSARESPDQQDRVPKGQAEPLFPTRVHRTGLGNISACAGCGRTQDLWEENNGEGIAHDGRRFCCKPCAIGKRCICVEMEEHKGSELGSLLRTVVRKKH